MSGSFDHSSDLIPYLVAKQILKRRFPDTTLEEFAMWAFLGSYPHFDETSGDLEDEVQQEWVTQEKNLGGFRSYYDNEKDRANTEQLHGRTCVGETIRWEEILSNLQLRRFSRAEIETFNPPTRWISYVKLLLRWSKSCSEAEAKSLIDNKLEKDAPGFYRELTMSYPVLIIDQVREVCMYSITEIELIEKKEFLVVSPCNAKLMDESSNGFEGSATVTWQEATKLIAEEVAKSLWASGMREITVRGIAPAVAKKLSENTQYFGQRGPRGESEIRKALKGWRFTPKIGGVDGVTGASRQEI